MEHSLRMDDLASRGAAGRQRSAGQASARAADGHPFSRSLMRLPIHRAVLTGLLAGAAACGRAADPSAGCITRSDTVKPQPVGAYRVYVDGSRSMAPFLAPANAGNVVTPYEEMLVHLLRTAPRDSAEIWLFGDTLVHLASAPEAQQQLVTRSTYQRGQSRLEFAFRHASAYLDSLAPAPGDSAAGTPPRPGRAGVAIIVTDGLQSGSGRQLHMRAEFDRMIRDHVAKGGSFALIAGMAGTYAEKSAGAVRPEGTKPVLAFLFGSGAARDGVEKLAAELSEELGARGQAGSGRYFVLPVRAATEVLLRPRAGVRQVLSADGEPPVFEFETGSEAVELLADVELAAATRANLPTLSIRIERCAGGAWEPAADPAGWSADSVRLDSAGTAVRLTLRRGNAVSARSGLFRVRLEGSPVPPWVAGFGAGRAGTEDDISRFFGGLRDLVGTDAASFGTFYLKVRAD